METTNQNGLVHSSQVINEQGSLTLGTLPLDLGMSQAFNVGEDAIVLADGRIVELTGTDEDIDIVVADCIFRLKQTLAHSYWIGKNLLSAKDFFQKSYGSTKEFWKKVTQATGLSRATLENRIRIYQNFTAQEVQTLTEAGVTQSIANRLLKASPVAKSEAVEEARQGKRITNAVVDELTGKDDEWADATDDNIDDEPTEIDESSNGSRHTTTATQSATEQVIDVQGSFINYRDLVTDSKDYVPSSKSTEERLQGLVASIYRIREKHEITTVRGESLRTGMTTVLAEFYGITLPEVEEQEDEPNWVKDARNKLPKGVKRKFNALYLMAFVDGHLAFINGETDAPAVYEKLHPTTFKEKEKVEAMYDLWAVGYGLAKAASK